MKVLNFDQHNSVLKLRDITSIPIELNDIFDICKNEIELSGGEYIELYSRIFFDCLMQFNNLTHGRVDMITCIRENLTKSVNEISAKKQYKLITRPTHILSAQLLKMLIDYKIINFIDVRLQKFDIFSIIIHLIKELFNETSIYSKSFKKQLLAAKIDIQ